jgi:LacI family transcriptional regulator
LWENELPLLIDWLKSLPKPVGLMACNDDRSQHVADACRVAKIHIPGDLALIGVDNDEYICTLSNPTLSSICLNPEMVGYQAAEILDAQMSGREVQNTTVIGGPTHVIARKSTDIMMVNDEDIHDALLYIRQNFNNPIQVVDVAQAVSISVRSLHKRFSYQVGCSVLDHIRRLRVERICQLLMETNWSVTQIANTMHFSSTKQLDRVFQHVKNTTPTEYRRSFRIK